MLSFERVLETPVALLNVPNTPSSEQRLEISITRDEMLWLGRGYTHR